MGLIKVFFIKNYTLLMKTLTLYLPLTILLYIFISIADEFEIRYFAFSKLIYIGIFIIALLAIYMVLKIYKDKNCFFFNKAVAIITVMIFSALSTNQLIENSFNIEKVFRYEVLSLNKKLPVMIDKNTRFDKVYFKGDNICYEYTLINVNSKKVNKDFITLTLTDKIYSQSAIDKALLKLSKKQRVINYIFHDKNENFLTKVELKVK